MLSKGGIIARRCLIVFRIIDNIAIGLKSMRQKTQKGYAIGTDDFIATLEIQLGIFLTERKKGRPFK